MFRQFDNFVMFWIMNMAFVPKKSEREYVKPLWKMKKDGTKGELVCHNCSKCGEQKDGNAKGLWFSSYGSTSKYYFVCDNCIPR
jgi:hypothetical protein